MCDGWCTVCGCVAMLPVKADVQAGASRLCPGARRSFFCRIKCKASAEAPPPESVPIKEEAEPTAKLRKKSNEKKYCVVQCTGNTYTLIFTS